MRKLCIRDLELDDALFVHSCEYEVEPHRYKAGAFLITDALGIHTEISQSILQQYFYDTIPEIGKTYKFYDDGKVGASRQYKALVLNVIQKKDAKKILLNWYDPDLCTVNAKNLYNIWKNAIIDTDWIFADDTDFLIECDIPDYDENHIWFARTKKGGWFSMDIQSSWQGGLLNVEEGPIN